jgi:hypothetical protein
MNQTLHLSAREMALLLSILSDKSNTDVEIEKSDAEFRVHYKNSGSSCSRAAVYSLAGSMLESAAKIRELEKKLF